MSMKSNILVGLVGAVLALTIPVKAAADDTVYATITQTHPCLLYTSPSPRDRQKSRMPSSA